jgi:hypothetical protein
MPKVSKVGKFRAAAKASAATVTVSKGTDDGTDADGKETLSRGQRKRLAKREQYLKREKMVMSSLRLQRLEEQKGKLDGLDAIRESLPAFKTSAAIKDTSAPVSNPLAPCSSNKSKKTLANTEISHMGLVLEHPAFQQNPFAAIQQHLRNSLAHDAEKLNAESLKRTEEEQIELSKKKEDRKERLRDAKFSKKKGNRNKNTKSGRPKR